MLDGFRASMRRVARTDSSATPAALLRYVDWQRRRALSRFPFEQTISRSRIVAPDSGSGVSALIHIHGLYDWNNMQLLQLVLSRGGMFLDVGANIGSYTLVASEQRRATVLAIEPHPATFAQLEANVRLNGRDNVELFQVALGAMEGELTFTDHPGSTENHVVPDDTVGAIRVPVLPADSICDERGAPDVVKVDVEGFEYPAISGLGRYLPEVKLMFVESIGLDATREHESGSVPDLLHGAGFEGPYRVDFKRRELRRGAPGFEDEAWVSPAFLHALTGELGFKEAATAVTA